MHLLVFTTLFPWPAVPHHGIFVRERLRGFIRRHGAQATVIAPVPYVPKALAVGRYASFRDVPPEETQEGIRVLHPRYPLLPKINMNWAPIALRRAGRKALHQLLREGLRFDLVDAHYLYPDAVGAVALSQRLQCPLIVTARGTDVNLIPQYRIPRMWLRSMLRHASAGITVCAALKEELLPLCPTPIPITVLGNGVDLEKFRPLAPAQARTELGWQQDQKIVLSVGHLIERKGHHHAIAALQQSAPDVLLKIVGSGEWEGRLRQQCRDLNLDDRVEFVGTMPHADLHKAYAAADVLTLLSSREGWPNVLLESMASGCPVVATKVWGSPEVVRSSEVGLLVDQPTPGAVAQSWQELFSHPRDRATVRQYAEQHSWDRVADGMLEVFEGALHGSTPNQMNSSPTVPCESL